MFSYRRFPLRLLTLPLLFDGARYRINLTLNGSSTSSSEEAQIIDLADITSRIQAQSDSLVSLACCCSETLGACVVEESDYFVSLWTEQCARQDLIPYDQRKDKRCLVPNSKVRSIYQEYGSPPNYCRAQTFPAQGKALSAKIIDGAYLGRPGNPLCYDGGMKDVWQSTCTYDSPTSGIWHPVPRCVKPYSAIHIQVFGYPLLPIPTALLPESGKIHHTGMVFCRGQAPLRDSENANAENVQRLYAKYDCVETEFSSGGIDLLPRVGLFHNITTVHVRYAGVVGTEHQSVRNFVYELAEKARNEEGFKRGTYNLLNRNCNSLTNAFLKRLGFGFQAQAIFGCGPNLYNWFCLAPENRELSPDTRSKIDGWEKWYEGDFLGGIL
eukprot:TRINITY_DN19393_c0_g1_i1.p1 TRINITY_DN19393_c0_g1~~TRINITY_DN19393_c0_g1_i1.p1  ORF type:complete len:383 (+),score=44.05 TRINITY_DN19393_c0_g1_i1:60-1208(+)